MATLTTPTKLKLAYAGLAATDAWLSGIPDRRAHRARFVTKPLLMPTLAASLVTSPRAADSPLRTTTLAAQAGGWGGDVALLGEGTRPFLAGTGSFARRTPGLPGRVRPPAQQGSGRHLTGRSGRRRVLGADRTGDGADGASQGARAGTSGPRLRHDARHDGGRRPPISTPTLSPASRRLTAAGAGMFMLSDTLLGIRKFVLADPPARPGDGRDGDVHDGAVPAQ